MRHENDGNSYIDVAPELAHVWMDKKWTAMVLHACAQKSLDLEI